MSLLKPCFETCIVLVILFAHICSSLDFRSFNTPDVFYIRNNTASTLNVSINKIMTGYPLLGSTAKTWKVGRVSRKQYEIVNMVWRRTNVFGDEGTTSPLPQKKDLAEPLTTVPQRFPRIEQKNDFSPTTMSYIEFYYLDEVPDPPLSKLEMSVKEEKKRYIKKVPEQIAPFKNFVPRPPILSFHVGKSILEPISQSAPPTSQQCGTLYGQTEVEGPYTKMNVLPNDNSLRKILAGNKAPQNVMPSPYTTLFSSTMIEKQNDKVKFFELYDSNTREPLTTDNIPSHKDNEIIRDKRITPKELDKKLGHSANKLTFAMKPKDNNNDQTVTQLFKSVLRLNNRDVTAPKSKSTNTPSWDDFFNYTSSELKAAMWSRYPFAAVYVYERLQIHCDAAAISPYWLVASAACLSRHRDHPNGDHRSAFIAYCGDRWWIPERIAYVKYTQVHPRYNPRDTVRRHLYNIGVIQVTNSMSLSCSDWAPVSIMSHQYVTDLMGSLGSAVGWGLDRYDTTYSSPDLPRHPFAVYEGHIFSDSCPGNSGYRSTKDISKEAVSNVYCLTLPPYAGEDTDPVHGGLLLVGGKLIALYLQEERRRWGDQSAQYTGVWRLIPWVLDVAKDPEEMDFSLLR